MKRKTIRNHNDFIVPRESIMVRGGACLVKTKTAKIPDDARYGIIAAKKIFKLATQRNRAKRLLRDWIAYNENLMHPDLDYIFIASQSILDYCREAGRKEIEHLLKKISKIYENK